MIQIYKNTNTNYEFNGDMFLLPSSCTVKRKLGADFSLTMKHPIDKEGRFSYLINDAVISAPTPIGNQLFRIYNIEKNNTSISIQADHISRDLKTEIIKEEFDYYDDPYMYDFLVRILPSPFTTSTEKNKWYYREDDISGYSVYDILQGSDEVCLPSSNKKLEVDFNNFDVKVALKFENEKNIYATFGYGLKEITEYIDTKDVITRGYYKDSENELSFDAGNDYVDSQYISNYARIREKTFFYSKSELFDDPDAWDDEEFKEYMSKNVQNEFENNNIDKPTVNYNINLSRLRKTIYYKKFGYDELEELRELGDIVHCTNKKAGIKTNSRMIGYEYNCIKKEFNSVELGDFIPNFIQVQTKYFKNLFGK